MSMLIFQRVVLVRFCGTFSEKKNRHWGYEALLTMDGLVHGSNLASESSAEKQSLAAWLSIVIPSGNLTWLLKIAHL